MNKRSLQNELKILNIMALYDFMCPIDYLHSTAQQILSRKTDAVKRYHNDPIFECRVKQIVARTMSIIEQNNPPLNLTRESVQVNSISRRFAP